MNISCPKCRSAFSFSPDGTTLTTSSQDETVRLWDVRNQLNVATIPVAPNRDVHTVSFTADGTTLLAAGEFGSAVWYDLTHLERHIAGNLEYYIERLGDELSDEELVARAKTGDPDAFKRIVSELVQPAGTNAGQP